MEIRNNKPPVEGSQPRRFSAGRATANPGANSFAAALKKAASEAKAPSKPATARPEAPLPSSEAAPTASQALQPPDQNPATPSAPSTPNAAGPDAEGKTPAAEAESSGADPDAAFADHMELVRFRLKTGYYASKAINDALTDKLSGYFDELA